HKVETEMVSQDFRRQLEGYGLTTANIMYRRPDHQFTSAGSTAGTRRSVFVKPKPRSASEEVAKLQQQLKAVRTRIQTLTREKNHWQAAAHAKPTAITKAQRNQMLKVLHPDGEAGASAKRKEQLTTAFQIFSSLKMKVVDTD